MSLAIRQKIKDLDLENRIEVIENADQSEMIKFLQNVLLTPFHRLIYKNYIKSQIQNIF